MDWTGRYADAAGGSMTVLQHERVLTVHGFDAGTTFQLTCVVTGNEGQTAECVGSGLNHEGPVRAFTYRSIWRRLAAGGFVEEWQAQFAEGSRSGKAEFKPVVPAAR